MADIKGGEPKIQDFFWTTVSNIFNCVVGKHDRKEYYLLQEPAEAKQDCPQLTFQYVSSYGKVTF